MDNIEDIYEGKLPRQLAFVLKQLEEMGVKRQDTDHNISKPDGSWFKPKRSSQFGLKLTEQKKPQPPQE